MRKLTLEERVARLERAIKNENSRVKYDSELARQAAVMLANMKEINPDRLNPNRIIQIDYDGYILYDSSNSLIDDDIVLQDAAKKIKKSIKDIDELIIVNGNAGRKWSGRRPATKIVIKATAKNAGNNSDDYDIDDYDIDDYDYDYDSDDSLHDDVDYRDMERSADWLKWQREPGSSTGGR